MKQCISNIIDRVKVLHYNVGEAMREYALNLAERHVVLACLLDNMRGKLFGRAERNYVCMTIRLPSPNETIDDIRRRLERDAFIPPPNDSPESFTCVFLADGNTRTPLRSIRK